MLIITRKPGESFVIEIEGADGAPELIEIKLLEGGSQVRLGVSAPQGCKVWRNEIYQTVLQNRQAAFGKPADLHRLLTSLNDLPQR